MTDAPTQSAADSAREAVRLAFVRGTLELRTASGEWPAPWRWDPRSACFRAPARAYADVVVAARDAGVPLEDEARRYATLEHGLRVERTPRPFQAEALDAWRASRGRGVVVLPTGAGKTHVALMAIDAMRRSALVVAPTLDLVRQWYDQLRLAFAEPVGVVGGGDYRPEALTVTTYDSAYLHMENLGNRYGLVVFDECHHLPSEAYALAADSCLAPYRLGLTATPERADGREHRLEELVGPTVYRRDIVEMTGEYLAEYAVQRVTVELTEDERADYEAARAVYREFLRSHGIRMSSPEGWQRFVIESSQNREGRAAMAAYQRQRRIAFAAPSKVEVLGQLLHRHRRDRALVFTQDNATAHAIATRFLVPVITHQTKVTERSEILEGLAEGRYGAVATSKVLNEGVDVPSANVAMVVSGSGSVREHVQRLGRILRKCGDKNATLYELIAGDTSEAYTSDRRRDHVAYR